MEPVYLTAGQIEYMAKAGGDKIGDQPIIDTAITDKSDNGWIFVEQAACVGEDGSGVWVDANGEEHYGPTGK